MNIIVLFVNNSASDAEQKKILANIDLLEKVFGLRNTNKLSAYNGALCIKSVEESEVIKLIDEDLSALFLKTDYINLLDRTAYEIVSKDNAN